MHSKRKCDNNQHLKEKWFINTQRNTYRTRESERARERETESEYENVLRIIMSISNPAHNRWDNEAMHSQTRQEDLNEKALQQIMF